MPHSRSSRKRVRQNERHRKANQAVRTAMRSQERRVLALVEAGNRTEAEKELVAAYQRFDKAAKVHVIHANTAANHKRKLAQKVAKLGKAKAAK